MAGHLHLSKHELLHNLFLLLWFGKANSFSNFVGTLCFLTTKTTIMKNFQELCKKRSSVRAFTPDPVPAEKLEYIMECVRLAPSAVNFQPWWFHIVRDTDELNRLFLCYDREWFHTCPLCIVACKNIKEEWKRKADEKPHGDIDVAIATEHLCLAAAEEGLGTCWVCNFDVEKCKTACHLSEELEPIALIPIGFPEKTAGNEKKRKDMSAICDL